MELVPLLDLCAAQIWWMCFDGLERAIRKEEEEVQALIDQRRNNGNNK
jgi:hypothetical protein